MLPHVIEPFFTTKPPGEGTGLGLSMTWRFLDSHGGSLKIDSTPGRGTAVRMWLPSVPVIDMPASTGVETSIQ
jgi:signal transduction histidine kinase